MDSSLYAFILNLLMVNMVWVAVICQVLCGNNMAHSAGIFAGFFCERTIYKSVGGIYLLIKEMDMVQRSPGL